MADNMKANIENNQSNFPFSFVLIKPFIVAKPSK